MRIFVLCAALGLATPLLYSQSEIGQTGRIIGRYHGPEACHVKLQQDYRTLAESICDNTGSFQFDDVPLGSYVIVTTAGQTYKRNVTVLGTVNEVDIYPEPAPRASSSLASVADLKVPAKAKHNYDKAKKDLANSNLAGASKRLSQALTIAPDYPAALTLAAAISLSGRNFADALRFSEKAVEIDPSSLLAHVTQASALNALGRSKEAALAAGQALQIDGSAWQAHFELARAEAVQRNLQSALEELNKAKLNAPINFAELYFLRALVFARLNNSDAARADANRFAKLQPNDPRLAQLESLMKK